jgi:hypothetical protein
MKYIKHFEAYYTFDQYVMEVTDILKSFNLTPLQLNKVVEEYESEMEKYYNEGKYPQVFVDSIKDQFDSSGGYLSYRNPKMMRTNDRNL